MKRACATAIMSVVGIFSVQASGGAPDTKQFVGRWNIQIQGTGDTFRTAWLKLTETDGKLGGALVWKWGSVVPIKNVEIEAGELRFTRGRNSYSAKLVGDKLHGVTKPPRGKELKFVGRRATEMTDIAGTWKVGLAERPDDPRATLVFEKKDGKITGKAIASESMPYHPHPNPLPRGRGS